MKEAIWKKRGKEGAKEKQYKGSNMEKKRKGRSQGEAIYKEAI